MPLDGINGQLIQTLVRGENNSKQQDEIQAKVEVTCHFYQVFIDKIFSQY